MTLTLKPLERQTIVITGASSGIGLATAMAAANRGAQVFLIARNADALEAAVDRITEAGGQADWASADVGDEDQVRAAAARAIVRFGGFDSWVNVAGVAIYSDLLATPRAEHERLFRTNYWGVVNGCTVAMEHLRNRGGALVTVGSVVSDIGTPVLGAYAASKHAVRGFIDSLRIELLAARAPVSVTLIKPAGIGSPLADHAANHKASAAKVPPPAYAPESVANAILDACQRPRRQVIVGGVGALQLLGAVMAPKLVDRVSIWIIPLLRDRRRAAAPGSNLFTPTADGAVRSEHEAMLPNSAYTAAMRRPISALAIVAAAAIGVVLWRGRRAAA